MLCTRVERIFEVLKKFFSPRRIWQKVLVPQNDLLKSFGTPTTKLNIARNLRTILKPKSLRTPDIEQKIKIPKSLTVFFNIV